MKIQSLRQHRGFTLVELLIVIAIIMVLASLGFAGVQTAMKRAKTVQSLNIATNVAQGIQNFYDEYGSLPSTNATASEIDTNSGEGVTLLRVLLGQEGSGTSAINTKSIRYLDIKAAKGKKAGLDYGTSGSTVNGLYDAWGEPFYVVFDDDYNDEIPNPIRFSTTEPAIIRGAKAIVYSKGADRKKNTKDDVKSF